MKETTLLSLSLFKETMDTLAHEITVFGNFQSLYMSLVAHNGDWEHYNGHIRFVDGGGNVVADNLDPANYREFIGEAVENYSYLKFPYYKPLGYPDGIYRVGPLARLNTCDQMGTELADRELIEYRERVGGTANSAFYYHYARLVEMLAAIEIVERLLADPDIASKDLRAHAEVNQLHSVGVSEAPRGTLFHDYTVDRDELMQKVNLVIATGQNNLAMNRTVEQIARHYIKGPEIPEGVLNRIEHGIRTYDPCLSCSTHAYGKMPMVVQLMDAGGNVVAERSRS